MTTKEQSKPFYFLSFLYKLSRVSQQQKTKTFSETIKFKVVKNGSKASGSVRSFNPSFDTEEESLYDQITTHVKKTFPTQQFELLFGDNYQLITPESLDNQSNVTRVFDKNIVVGE